MAKRILNDDGTFSLFNKKAKKKNKGMGASEDQLAIIKAELRAELRAELGLKEEAPKKAPVKEVAAVETEEEEEELDADEAEEEAEDSAVESSGDDYTSMTPPELKALAKERGLEFAANARGSAMIKLLMDNDAASASSEEDAL